MVICLQGRGQGGLGAKAQEANLPSLSPNTTDLAPPNFRDFH